MLARTLCSAIAAVGRMAVRRPALSWQVGKGATGLGRVRYGFSGSNEVTVSETGMEAEVKVSTAKLGEREVELHQTKGSISILDRVQGVKAESGEMYILKFTCNKCETQSIRSFTKHAYHKGVVMVRCGGCEAIHLIADNIGWF